MIIISDGIILYYFFTVAILAQVTHFIVRSYIIEKQQIQEVNKMEDSFTIRTRTRCAQAELYSMLYLLTKPLYKNGKLIKFDENINVICEKYGEERAAMFNLLTSVNRLLRLAKKLILGKLSVCPGARSFLVTMKPKTEFAKRMISSMIAGGMLYLADQIQIKINENKHLSSALAQFANWGITFSSIQALVQKKELFDNDEGSIDSCILNDVKDS